MAQYSEGTVSTVGTAVITGSGTSWLTEASTSDYFIIPVDSGGDGVVYEIASVDSDTQITLSAPYAGANVSGVSYAIARDFTPNESLPKLNRRDVGSDGIFSKAMALIDTLFGRAAFKNEANTFTQNVTIQKATPTITLDSTTQSAGNLVGDSDRSGAGADLLFIDGRWAGTTVALVKFGTGLDTVNKDDGYLAFFTKDSSPGALTERARVAQDGNFLIGTTASSGSGAKLQVNGGTETSRIIYGSPTELTISAGAITVTGSYHSVDTEADAATDDLSTINGGVDGAVLILKTVNNGRDVTLKDGVGNLLLAGDFTLDTNQDRIQLQYDATQSAWVELSRSNNA